MFYTLLFEVWIMVNVVPILDIEGWKDCYYLEVGVISKKGTILTDIGEITKPHDKRL